MVFMPTHVCFRRVSTSHQSGQTRVLFEVLPFFFPGCESPEEQQKSDRHGPDSSCTSTQALGKF